MTRKVLFLSLLSLVLSICTSVVCFANTDNNTVTLGNEVTSSLERGMDTVTNAAEDVVNGGATMIRDGVNTVGDVFNRNDNNYYNDNNNNTRNNTNNTTGYNTNGYNTLRTAEETNLTNNSTMSTTTWMWIIFALAAIIIIAAIWYYAMQGNDRD